MKNIFAKLGVLIAGILSFSGAAFGNDRPVKIGAIMALSGDAASIGSACRNGMILAKERLPKDLGDKIELVFEDDRNVPSNTISALQKLVDLDSVNLLVSWSSGTSNAVAPLADQKKIPLIAIASDPKVVQGRTHVVNLWVTPEVEAAMLVSELQRRGIRRIARISTLHEGILSLRTAFDAVRPADVALVVDEEVAPDVKDFKPFLTKLRTHHDIDAIFVNLYAGQVGLFAKQTRAWKINVPLFNVETFEVPSEVALSDGALIGQWYIQAGDPADDFSAQYSKRFPDASLTTAANCHDTVLLVAEAIRLNRQSDLNGFLHQVKDFTGALGTFSSTADNKFTLPAIVKVVKENGFEKLAAR